MMFRRVLLIWPLLLSLVSCLEPPFDRSQMLADITTHVILRNHEVLVAQTATLLEKAHLFADEPVDVNLAALQIAWRSAAIAWLGCTPFEFDVVQEVRLHNRMDNRPARRAFIEEVIAGDEEISAAMLATVGSSSQGLSAIEYLIFGENVADPRRAQYVVAAAALLHQNAQDLYGIWSVDGDNYAQQFIEADVDGGEIQGSMNMLFNHMLEQLEMITWERLGKPLGKRTGGEARPDLVEAPLSGMSLVRMQKTVATLHDLYTADGEGLGFDDYLDYLEADYDGQPLSHVIEAQFNRSSAALLAIDEPLSEAVERDPAAVEAAYDALRRLIILLKVDAANHLGVTLTFNDNDGD